MAKKKTTKKSIEKIKKKSVEKTEKKVSKTTPKKSIATTGTIAADQVIRTIQEAARYAGVTERTVRRWVQAGMTKTEDGRFVKSLLDAYKNGGREDGGVKNRKETAEADVKELKAKLLQMDIDLREGKLIVAEDVEKGRVERILVVRRALLSLGRKLAKRLSVVDDAKKIEQIIKTECREIINNFAGENVVK